MFCFTSLNCETIKYFIFIKQEDKLMIQETCFPFGGYNSARLEC